ncbi:S1 RNA-binding domain-containing protein [Streptomyces sp. NPDC021608]|uniref:S1 RNA-binding domain-containing protein n=1 Tax=Streptomyces sp. NPDC021608 TaxID=3154903 RepID=UPI0033CDD736
MSCFVHLRELTGAPVHNASDAVRAGDEVTVVVTESDRERHGPTLSRRQASSQDRCPPTRSSDGSLT